MFGDNDGNGTPEALQEDHYYPFGLNLADGGIQAALPAVHLYNGKELQDELGLGWYDYGARMYSPTVARWNGVDFHAKSYTGQSPFNYVFNNPLRFVDPNGMDPSDSTKNAMQPAPEGDGAVDAGTTEEVVITDTAPRSPTDDNSGSSTNNQARIAPPPVAPPPPKSTPSWLRQLGLGADAVVQRAIPFILFMWPGELGRGSDLIEYDPASGTYRNPYTGHDEDEDEYISIWKAPQGGMAARLMAPGAFNETNFPNSPPYSDGHAYFAGPNDRALAEEYARSYGEGVIELRFTKSAYEKHLRIKERNYQGGPQRELPVPSSKFHVLNSAEKIYHP